MAKDVAPILRAVCVWSRMKKSADRATTLPPYPQLSRLRGLHHYTGSYAYLPTLRFAGVSHRIALNTTYDGVLNIDDTGWKS